MIYCIDPTSDEPIMLLNKHIGFDETDGQGIDGSLFQSELLQLDSLGKKRIQIWINSPGGVVMDGYNIYSTILKTKTKVDTYCMGIAASIAAVIFQAGRNRIMSDYSRLMYHEAHGTQGKQLEIMNSSIATMIASRAGKTEEEVLAMMRRTTWIKAEEAFMNGFCSDVEYSNEQNKKRVSAEVKEDMPEPQQSKAMWTAANKVLNSIFSDNKKTKMDKVTNKLGLSKDASEDSILAAIVSTENKLSAKESELTTVSNKLSEKEAELTKVTNSFNELKAEKEAADKAKQDAEKATEVEKAKNMVEGFAKAGRIKNEAAVINEWCETAVTLGFEKTKNMIEALPLNKSANKIEPNKLNAGELPTSAVSLMAKVQNSLKK